MSQSSPHPAEVRADLENRRAAAELRILAMTGEIEAIVAASLDSNADDEHDPEGSTIAFERAQASAVLDQARTQLDELNEALARLQEGRYGLCEGCGAEIAAARLVARPAARTCMKCATAN